MSMAKKTKADKKTKSTVNKVSYHYRPDNMTLQDWQIALRRQAAMKEKFVIFERDKKEYPGYYTVINPTSGNEYNVVYRGHQSPWNYCSCMDFKASQLGTCKHLEGVKLWIREKRRKVCRVTPPYSSVYLSYQGERKVCLRIGMDNEEEFRKLASPYFTPDGVMRPAAIDSITEFLRAATRLNNTFRWYPDDWGFILEQRDLRQAVAIATGLCFGHSIGHIAETKLYPYQKEGIRFAFRAGKSIIADEMGLGKTIQAIGTAELMRKYQFISSVSDYMPYIIEISMEKGNRAFYRCQGYCGRRKSPDQESAIWSGRIL